MWGENRLKFCAAAASACLALAAGAAAQETYAVRNATIVTVSGPIIEKGTVVISGGKIAAVGRNVKVPGNARIIDASGLRVYPGLIDSGTALGLTEIGSVPATQDTNEVGDINPHLKAAVALNPHSELIPVARANGITAAISAPRGGLISGQSALIQLDGWVPSEMVIKAPAAIHVNFPRLSGEGGGFELDPAERREETREARIREARRRLERLKSAFRDAEAYAKAREASRKAGTYLPPDLKLEALAAAIRGEVPVVLHVDREEEIKAAAEFAEEFKLKAILAGAGDAARTVDLLKSKNIPVILGPILSLPRREDDPYDSIFTTAKVLHEAGVRFAIQSNSSSDVRNLPYHAAMAAAYGLPKEEALKAITLYPAQIFGVADKLGSIEPGKIANLIVTDGDPLEIRTQVKYLFINGRPVSLKTRHTELYEKFLQR